MQAMETEIDESASGSFLQQHDSYSSSTRVEDFIDEPPELRPNILSLKTKLRKMMEDSSNLLIVIPTISIVLSYLGSYVAKYPFFVVDYGSEKFLGIGLKDSFSYAFTIGFFVGKFPAYVYVPTVVRNQRFRVLLVLFAVGSLLMTGFLPLPSGPLAAAIQVFGVFMGSIFCSAIFGVEMLYMEGRSKGDILVAAMLCVVFFGPSLCRAIGESLILTGIPGSLMPLLLVLLYSPVVMISLFCLDAIPDPSEADVQARGERTVMTASQKTAFLRRHGMGLTPLLVGYAFSAGFRFLRDFFALEVYRDFLQREPQPMDYLMADWVGGIVSIISILAMSRVADNTLALMLLHGMLVGSGLVMGVGAFLFTKGLISPELFIISVGIGVAAATTPFSGSLFDRVIACTRTKGTAIFLIFFGDAVMYIGVLLCLLYKTTRSSDTSYSELFLKGCYAFTGILSITGLLSAVYWMIVSKKIRDGAYDEMGGNATESGDDVSQSNSSNHDSTLSRRTRHI
mmetsp:Transcript_14214/g.21005  ORF Transcript_14214/g.21005 Transcript_14214/m.21005 type:complete len:511 (+) Transcript_14214:147-1679(+)